MDAANLMAVVEDPDEQASLLADRLVQVPHGAILPEAAEIRDLHLYFLLRPGIRYTCLALHGSEFQTEVCDGGLLLRVTSLEFADPHVEFWARNEGTGILVVPRGDEVSLAPTGELVEANDDFELADYPDPEDFLARPKKIDRKWVKGLTEEETDSLRGTGFCFVVHPYEREERRGYRLLPNQQYFWPAIEGAVLEIKQSIDRIQILDEEQRERSAIFVLMNKTPRGILILPQKTRII